VGVPGSLRNRSSMSPAQRIKNAEVKINAERFLEMHRAV